MNKYDVLLLSIVVVISAAVALGMKGGVGESSNDGRCAQARRALLEIRACEERGFVCTQMQIIRRSRALEEVNDACRGDAK